MALNRTITAPGVEMREIDLSEYASNVQQTAVLVTGFADQGEINTTQHITSKTSLLNQFGKPTNEEERYFHAACNEVLNQGGVLYATRLPYANTGTGFRNAVQYSFSKVNNAADDTQTAEAELLQLISKETGVELSVDTYSKVINAISDTDDTIQQMANIKAEGLSIITNDNFDKYLTEEESVGTNKILIVDKLGTTYSKTSDGKECLGIIPVITTAANALYFQDLIDLSSSGADYADFGVVSGFRYRGNLGLDSNGDPEYDPFDLSESDFAIDFNSENVYDETLSRIIAREFPSIGFVSSDRFEKEDFKKIGVVVLRAYVDVNNNNKLNFSIVESFVGSLDPNAVDSVTGMTTFIDTIVNNSSEFIYLFSNVNTDEISESDILYTTNQTICSLGFTAKDSEKTISVSSINKNLNVIFEKNSDIHEKQIDIVVDAGITNIAQIVYSIAAGDATSTTVSGRAGSENIDPVDLPKKFTTNVNILIGKNTCQQWLATAQKFDNFCKNVRKDCMFICDGPRFLALQGSKKKIRPSKPEITVDSEILPKLKFLAGLNSNYTAGYCDWFQIADDTTGKIFWCPPSIKAMGCYIYTDINYNSWDAPAGQKRGVMSVLDCAFSPSIKQAGSIYDKAWNYAINFADVGIILEGQKTMQQRQSAFDRVNVRRLFLRLERQTYHIARKFVYEPNNAFTRERFRDMLDPVFAAVKANGGCYDYKIIVDESINTPEVIDNNELRVKIGVKPTKTAEFILVEFYALRTGGSWDEMGA